MAGTIDAWAEGFSVGLRNAGDLMLMYGSTMFMVRALDQPRTHRKLWATVGVEPGTLSIAAGMATSGALTNWLQGVTGGVAFETLAAEASEITAGANGLLMLPYFAGERSPLYDPEARGVIAGLTLVHTRAHLARAIYEATAYGVRHNVAVMEEISGPPARMIAVGGGTKNKVWMQIVSDVTGVPQHVPAVTIGASYGDALLAAIGTGLVPPDTDWTVTQNVVAPNAANSDLYDEFYRLYRQLYSDTAGVIHQLAALHR
jgi:xylulokinase